MSHRTLVLLIWLGIGLVALLLTALIYLLATVLVVAVPVTRRDVRRAMPVLCCLAGLAYTIAGIIQLAPLTIGAGVSLIGLGIWLSGSL